MADYYTQFSFLLPIPEEKKEEAVAWLKSFNDAMSNMPEQGNEEADADYWERLDEWTERFGGFDRVEMDDHSGHIWVCSDDAGSVDTAIDLIQDYLKTLDLDIGVYFSWCNSCSKPRINAFSGGGAVVTKDDYVLSRPDDCLQEVTGRGIEVFTYEL